MPGLRACLTVSAVNRPPSALIWDSNSYPQTYPQVRGRILANLGERVKSPNRQIPDFTWVSGRPRTSANGCWRRERDSNSQHDSTGTPVTQCDRIIDGVQNLRCS